MDPLPDAELVDEYTKRLVETALEMGREGYWRRAAAEVDPTELATLRTRHLSMSKKRFGNRVSAPGPIAKYHFNI
jgi:hypothetical protein